MAKKKLKNVDTGLCDRFMYVIDCYGFENKTVLKIFGLKSISMINEIRKHTTEPSKKLIKIAAEELGFSADWLLIGRGIEKIKTHNEFKGRAIKVHEEKSVIGKP